MALPTWTASIASHKRACLPHNWLVVNVFSLFVAMAIVMDCTIIHLYPFFSHFEIPQPKCISLHCPNVTRAHCHIIADVLTPYWIIDRCICVKFFSGPMIDAHVSGRSTLRSFVEKLRYQNAYVVSQLPTPMHIDVRIPNVLGGALGLAHQLLEVDLWMSTGSTRSVIHKDGDNVGDSLCFKGYYCC